jgi:ferredoxin, 2Fe-2S
MGEIVVFDRDGREIRLKGEAGASVMLPLRAADVGVAAVCGGTCACATCHVLVDETWLEKLPPAQAEELELLSGLAHSRGNSRLACQIPFGQELDGLRLTIAPEE